ncbi:4-alpha-glucanotransferase [Thiomicrospira aerophila AL3]|uniref:4-alpha-glucanotransferase n=1 Tax=Thiomicrospira aerophila AL3 TaxID=717772 RepID=W0DXR2_9GAMM|nr:4-alpha-glucanotransferase [Thiomicrospira aerophila]AHF01764.1 4-alpha-glucanotransferase [Thiomicrospira aerophila AL3]
MISTAGLLLHPTSLPSGVLDADVERLLDWMAQAGLKVWQMLPLTPPHGDLSPYQSLSAFALSPALLPCNWAEQVDEQDFTAYLESPPSWLHDFALFCVLKAQHQQACWSDWPDPFKYRDAAALEGFSQRHHQAIISIKRQQFALQQRWQVIKSYAQARHIQLFGDMPIFVAYDSADVWANPQEFLLDEQLQPTYVTGVPPDYFSETGQRWGNPHYNWSAMQQQGFKWWLERMGESFKLFDLVRIDHFRGLEASWYIPATEPTAINGEWRTVPGEALLMQITQAFPEALLVAEDLGIITPEVVALKNAFNLPGMAVLQFGFSGLPDNPHSPSSLIAKSVVYTGTHDNDTSLGWFNNLAPDTQHWVLSQLPADGAMPWPLIAGAMASPAERVMIPMQDFLGLNSDARMNTPGTTEHNWRWRFDWADLPADLASRIRGLVAAQGRI